MKQIFILFVSVLITSQLTAQSLLRGRVLNEQTREPVAGVTIQSSDSSKAAISDEKGNFQLERLNNSQLILTAVGFETRQFSPGSKMELLVLLTPIQKDLDAVVISGTMKMVKKTESPVAVEVYTPQFLKKNPAPSIFESLSNVNGVRPQLNCSVCNTGDIHINGLEGPYTMITIDGMPIVSSLGSVYGLFGIPTQLIERVEIVKGPASGLYGSEAIGGLINIITKSPDRAPRIAVNAMTTSWLENSLDLGVKFKLGEKAVSLLGVDYFHYQHKQDRNQDRFTDVTLQHRISVFNKINLLRKHNRVASIAGRYFYEDRWGGDMRWTKQFRGSDSIYGESIYTSRWELLGNYQLPVKEKIFLAVSATSHQQNSWYGITPYFGTQRIAFSQLTWDKMMGQKHSLLSGLALRYNYYDDNSTATIDTLSKQNRPDDYLIPGMFIQDEWKLNPAHTILFGLRYDHHPVHKGIWTPRFAWKWAMKENEIFRLNAGTGFRVVSLFTEEHAALTGARSVEIREALKPEKSYNVNLNYTRLFRIDKLSLNADISGWYSHFTNQIIADYDTDPNKIIYQNLRGYSSSKGITINLDLNTGSRFKALLGATLQDVSKTGKEANGNKTKITPVLTEKWSGTWSVTYSIPAQGITVDYTGNIYGPMRLPLISASDPRPGYSPVWSIQNIQISKWVSKHLELFAGIKNLLNWTPAKSTPFIIARSHDPFDKQVEYGNNGEIIASPENPYALSFDPSYVYAPNQGIRFFGGLRFSRK